MIKKFTVRSFIMSIILYLTVSTLFIYGGVAGGLYLAQRKLMYHPTIEMLTPAEYNVNADEIIITTEDNIKIKLWYAAPKKNQKTILYFHGNTAHLSFRAEKFEEFINKGFGLVAVSYRGYGGSEGFPFEAGLYDDAKSAYNYLTDILKTRPENIIIYGESLGSGVATELATHIKAAGLVLEAPYTSIVDVAAEKYPYIPVRYLLKDKFENINKIDKINMPLLIFHGLLDNVIPVKCSHLLFEKALEPKEVKLLPKISHTNFDPKYLTDTIKNWIATDITKP